MTHFWDKNISKAVTGEYTPRQAMDHLAEDQDNFMKNLHLLKYSHVLNPEMPREYWLNKPGGFAPRPERKEREKPVTVDYDDLIKQWKQ